MEWVVGFTINTVRSKKYSPELRPLGHGRKKKALPRPISAQLAMACTQITVRGIPVA
jgi:hypothetical protein